MKTPFVVISIGILIAVISAFMTWLILDRAYKQEIIAARIEEQKDQAKPRFIAATILQNIELIEESKLDVFYEVNCKILAWNVSGVVPEFAETTDEQHRLRQLLESASQKAMEMEREGKCLTSQSNAHPSAAGTAQSAAPN